MLPKQHRLPLRTELRRVKKEGRFFQGKLFGLLISHQPLAMSHQLSRFAFIISTKVHKKAVRRNHARRLLSEAIKEFLPQIKPGFNVVFLAKKSLIEADFNEIKQEVALLLKKVRLLS
ncbi:MAG: ribonuclease P protein component [Candidatus Shapirobacteria bacterium]|nr:ribonuclease P protein component [Candidatus Shapirobacteria bacterium]